MRSLTTEEKENKKISKWPFIWGFLLYTAGNVDYIIIPLVLEPLGLSFWSMFWIANLVANLEIVGGFYFWSWFAWKWLPTTKPVKETVELTKDIISLLREYGLLGTIVYKVRETFEWATDSKGKFRVFIEAWGRHVGMFVLGAESIVSGGRLVGTILCASMKWKSGIVSLIMGNIIHVAISIGMWKLFFFSLGEYKGWLILITSIIISLVIGRFIWKKLRSDKESPKSP